jgi:sugar phosphate isomerase/epimerase
MTPKIEPSSNARMDNSLGLSEAGTKGRNDTVEAIRQGLPWVMQSYQRWMGVYQRSASACRGPDVTAAASKVYPSRMLNRRDFVFTSLAFSASAFAVPPSSAKPRFAHRQANIVVTPGQSVFEFATHIPGLSGIELQVIWKGQDVGDFSNSLAAGYKADSKRWGIDIPSIAGVWKPGEKIFDAPVAEKAIANAIRTAEFLNARVILIALYNDNCPRMEDEASYAPVVALLQKLAPAAMAAGVSLGLETSLSPADEKKLLTMVGSAAVRSYYDTTNCESYHPGEAISGIEIMGPRIVQCHFKNGDQLLEAPNSPVDWRAAVKALHAIHYNGWYVFETNHSSPEQCIQATTENIKFITSQVLEKI